MAEARRRKARPGSRRQTGPLLTRPATVGAETLARVMAVLTDEQRQVLVWYYYEGVDMPEIAGWLGTSKQSIQFRLDRIDAALRRAGLPKPTRLVHPYATRDVINVILWDSRQRSLDP